MTARRTATYRHIMRTLAVIVPITLLAFGTHAQVNGYARVSALASTTLTIAESNETGGNFATNDFIVLMQMQGDVIGSNTANNSSFGNLNAIANVGRYEILRIASVTRTAGVLNTIVLTTAPTLDFSTAANARLQAITFERLGGGGNFTTTAAIPALPWNGNIGGVVAIEVAGRLTVAHNITADGAGFRGGAADADNAAFGSCDGSTFVAASTSGQFGLKGEGIYRLTNTAWAKSKGKLLNGGGGGNSHNGGGGGGGNYTAGGLAGAGYNSVSPCHAGGIGGIALSGHIGATRVFMGGGGGGGEGNNGVSSAGTNGGGIILIKADTIRTTGVCTGLRISANGANAVQAGNDGAGGGGAGGSIVIDANAFHLATGCVLNVQANGGNGGRVNSNTHSGGGGGGQGVVIFSSTLPTSGIAVTTNNGAGGCNNNTNPCNSFAGSGTGTNGTGIITGSTGPLPIQLIRFHAIPVRDRVDLSWSTATELENELFTVERSADGSDWKEVVQLPGAGTSHWRLDYRAVDHKPLAGVSYYRLKQTDTDGRSTWSTHVPVHLEDALGDVVLVPNPANDRFSVFHGELVGPADIRMYDRTGRAVAITVHQGEASSVVELRGLPNGHYTLAVQDDQGVRHAAIMVQH
jgi:hypothetical protein